MALKFNPFTGNFDLVEPPTIGSPVVGSTANRLLYMNGDNVLQDDLLKTYFVEIDLGGGNSIISRGWSDATYDSESGADPSVGFVDLTDIGGGRNIALNLGSGTGRVLWSDGTNTLGDINASGMKFLDGVRINEFSSDGTLAGNADTVVPTEQAVKTYVDTNTISEVVDDLTPQLGGDLDLNGNDITGTGSISYTGNLTLLNGDLDMNDTSTNRILLPAGTTSQPAVQFAGTTAGMTYESGALLFVNSSGVATFRAGPNLVYFAQAMQSYTNANGFDISVGTGLGSRIYGTRRTSGGSWADVGYGFHATEQYAPAVYSQTSGGTKQMNMWWGNAQQTVTMGTLQLFTGTTTKEPLKFTNGSLLSSPVKGAMEFANDRLYFTAVGKQRAIDRTSDVVTSTTTVSNTTTETTVWTGTIGANDLKVGNILKIFTSGLITNDSAADDITINVYIGSTLVETYNPAIGNVANADWHTITQLCVRSVGASGSIAVHGEIYLNGNIGYDNSIQTIDTTVAENITVKVQWDNAKTGNTISLYQGHLEIKN